MRVQFILQPFKVEWLGTAFLSAALKKAGHETRLSRPDDYEDMLYTFQPDVVAFSVLTGSHLFYLDIARHIDREFPNIKIAVGGPHVTYYDDYRFLEIVDFICRGEGDMSFPDWVSHFSLCPSNVQGEYIEWLDELPFPDRDFLYTYPENRNNPIKNFMASRGCPWNCTYCFNHVAREMYPDMPVLRMHSVDYVIEEIRQVKKDYPLELVYFQDDVLPVRKDWFKDLMVHYRSQINLPFHCHLRVEYGTQETIELLQYAGCRSVTFAIESGSEGIREKLLNRHMSNEQILACAKRLENAGIKFRIENMLGLPNETIAQAISTMKLNAVCRPTYGWAGIYQPYPGTKLAKETQKRGLWDGDFDSVPQTFFERTALCNHLPSWGRQVNNLQKLFAIGVRFPWLTWLIRLLIKLPENRLFKCVGNLFKMWGYKRLYDSGA